MPHPLLPFPSKIYSSWQQVKRLVKNSSELYPNCFGTLADCQRLLPALEAFPSNQLPMQNTLPATASPVQQFITTGKNPPGVRFQQRQKRPAKNKTGQLSRNQVSRRQLIATSLVYLQTTNRAYLVPLAAITVIELDHKRIKVHFEGSSVVLSSSLAYLKNRLPADLFIRVNRAQIVNTSFVETVNPLPDGALQLVLQDRLSTSIVLSRRQASLFKQKWGL
jgi:hypothetical protein